MLQTIREHDGRSLTTAATPSHAKRLAIEDETIQPFDGVGSIRLAGERDEGTPFAKVDLYRTN